MTLQFMIFFAVFFNIYFGAHGYLFLRAWQALEAVPQMRFWFGVFFWVSALTYVAGRFVERAIQNTFSDLLVWYGALWLAIFAYTLILVAGLDIVRSVFTVAGHDPAQWVSSYPLLKLATMLAVIVVTSLVVALGLRTALTPTVRTLTYTIEKDGGEKNEWSIVFASDIHLGTIVSRERAQQLVGSIRELTPDLVLLGGDIVDEDLTPVTRSDIGNVLRQIDAPYGTYAILGNHEYIGGVEEALRYLRDHEITILRDETVLVGNSFYLVGRDDVSGKHFGGSQRASLEQLMSGVDTTRPIVMMDHQPHKLGTVAADGRVDLQLSGHTHHGQLWPFNFVTMLLFEKSWGETRIGKTQFYISNGWGTWGPPIRIGNKPELVHITLRFTRRK